MCQYKSAIIVPDEREKGGVKIYHNQWTDSHEDLVSFFNLRDKGKLARVEYHPNDPKDLADLSKYKLTIDEQRTPDWLDEEKQDYVTGYMRDLVDKMILKGDVEILLGGVYIVPKGVTVGFARQTMMIYVAGTVTRNYGTVTTNDGTVTRNAGTVTRNDGTVTTNDGTVTTNDGTVTRNAGTVTRNYGTVTRNDGTVTTNDGTVTRNYGTVTTNDGTVTRNYGTVTRNDGTVTRNAGTVTTNDGTVTTNDGTVTRNAGTVTTNDGTYGKIMEGNQSTHIPRPKE